MTRKNIHNTMNTYKFSFVGRQAGAIGITYPIRDTYKAKDIHEALSLLYMDYDLFHGVEIHENGNKIDQPKEIKWVKVRSTGSYKYARKDAPKDYKY